MNNRKYIPLSEPIIDEADFNSVLRSLKDGWVSSSGPDIEIFEQKFAQYVGVDYAVACSSGTAAIHLALIACGVRSGDEVLVPALTFIGTVNPVSYIGAHPVFVDVDSDTLGIDVCRLRQFIKCHYEVQSGKLINKQSGRQLTAILPVHLLGMPCDILSLVQLAQEYNLLLVEDACESLGSLVGDKMPGIFGQAGCFSFNGNKIITTGGGGMVVTNDADLAKSIKHLSTTAKTDAVNFTHDMVGYNYRLINVLASLGISQLDKIDNYISKRRAVNSLYCEKLKGLKEVEVLVEPEGVRSNHWLTLVRFNNCFIKTKNLAQIIEHFSSYNIQTRPLWTLVHQMPMYKHCFKDNLYVSEEIHAHSLTFPSSPNLDEPDIDYICMALQDLLCKK